MTAAGLARDKRRGSRGFTLAELLVATTMMAMVMTAVYTALHGMTLTWRASEANLHAHHDARISMSLLTRELQSTISGAGHLFEGSRDSVEFFTVGRSMDVEEGGGLRLMWVRYRLRSEPNEPGDRLEREEAFLDAPIPLEDPDEDTLSRRRLRLGRTRSFDLAHGVEDLSFRYYWHPPAGEEPLGDRHEMENGLLVFEENREGWGLPQGMRIELSLADEENETSNTFATMVVFQGPTTELDGDTRQGPLGGGSRL